MPTTMKYLLVLFLCTITTILSAQTIDEHYNQASEALENEDYPAALQLIDQVLAKDQSNPDYFDIRAISLFYLKEYKAANNTYKAGLKLFPKEATLYNSRANMLLSLRQVELALKDYTKAIELAETDKLKIGFLSNRSGAKMHTRDFDGAYDDLMIAYELDSTNLATLTNLGVVCDETGRGNETLKYLIKVVEIDSLYFPAYINIGFKYQFMNKHEEAIPYFNKALEISPNEPLGYSNRSFSYLKIGKTKAAMRDIDKSIKLYPGNSYAYKIRALIFIEEKKFKKACVDLEEALKQGYTRRYGDEVLELQKKHCK